jgi:hypothetical protein
VPLSLPNLDDLRWRDLVAEGRSLIPASAPEWTNHNPSDPGITLIELFGYVSERLMYQLNRVGDGNVAEFLSLINGPRWKEEMGLRHGADISPDELRVALKAAVATGEKRRTVSALLEPTRAVTSVDFELLTSCVATVARAKCVAGRDLNNDDPVVRMREAPGHVSVVVLAEGNLHPSRELLAKIRQALEPARLLTTRVHVVAPRYVKLGCRITITPIRGSPREALQETAVTRLKLFLDPHQGWFNGKGWPWGRNVYVSELYQVLSEIRGVDRVAPTRDSQGAPVDELVVDPSQSDRLKRNNREEIEAVELRPDELIDPQIGPADIAIAAQG